MAVDVVDLSYYSGWEEHGISWIVILIVPSPVARNHHCNVGVLAWESSLSRLAALMHVWERDDRRNNDQLMSGCNCQNSRFALKNEAVCFSLFSSLHSCPLTAEAPFSLNLGASSIGPCEPLLNISLICSANALQFTGFVVKYLWHLQMLIYDIHFNDLWSWFMTSELQVSVLLCGLNWSFNFCHSVGSKVCPWGIHLSAKFSTNIIILTSTFSSASFWEKLN